MKSLAFLFVLLTLSAQVFALNRYQNAAGDLMITDQVLTDKEMSKEGWFLEQASLPAPPRQSAPVATKTGNPDVGYWENVLVLAREDNDRRDGMSEFDIGYSINKIDSSLELLKTDTRIPTSYRAKIIAELQRLRGSLGFARSMKAAVRNMP